MKILIEKVNLNSFTSSFPSNPENEIIRENIVKYIFDSFSPKKKIILIEDDQFTGKTTLLSQFARTYPDKCVSFFIGDDFWSSNLHRFLSELCEQMKYLCIDAKTRKAINEIDVSLKTENDLIHLFSHLNSLLLRQVKNGNGPYYFVIDGLDKVSDESTDNILRYMPTGSPDGIYILLSSRKGKTYNYLQFPMTLPRFSLLESEKYLRDCLTEEQIKEIFKKSEGLPGYLQEVRRQIKSGINLEELLNNPPQEIIQLLENQWDTFDKGNETLVKALSFVVFSPSELSLNSLSRLMILSESEVIDIIYRIPFMKYDTLKNNIEILYTYKSFLIKKLNDNKTMIDQELISFFEKNPTEENLFVFLPELYKQNGKFNAFCQLINESSLIEMLGTHGQVSIVRRNLKLLAEMSYHENEWQKLAWATLMQAVFTQIITSPPAIEEEINALLSLEKHEQAIPLAIKCILPEDRLKLLSNICNYLKERSQDVPENLMRILEDSVYLIDNTIELTEKVIDKLLDISAEIFPFNPNLALKLVKRIAEEKGEDHRDKLMDILIMRLLTKIEPDPNSIEEIKNHLGDKSIYKFTKATSTTIASNSIESILGTVKDISDVSAKLFLLQTWCNTNHDHPSCYEVISHAFDIMTESTTYSPTMVHLREFASPLLNSIELEKVKQLVNKIDILKETIIKNPLEEYARLEVTLAEIETRWSADEATKRLYTLIFFLDDIEELDSQCQVLVWILLSLHKIRPEDVDLENELKEKFKSNYENLLKTSANHSLISKRIIPVLTEYDPNMAESFIGNINLLNRRDFAYSILVREYVLVNEEDMDFTFIDKIISKISYIHLQDWVFVQVLRTISESCKNIETRKKLSLKERVYSIKSLIGKTYALSFYLVLLNGEDNKLKEALFTHLKENLMQIDSLEQKMITGYRVTRVLSTYDMQLANEIYELTNNNKTVIAFSDRRINELYIATCSLLINTVPEILKSANYNERIEVIIKLIESIPSKYNQISLLNALAIKCFVSGENSILSTIAKKGLRIIEECPDEEVYNHSLNEFAPTLFFYEREILFEKLDQLPTLLRDNSLFNIIKVIVSKRLPDDTIDLKALNAKIDYKEAVQVCDLLDKMTDDGTICGVITCISNLITEPTGTNRLRGTLSNEKQLLNIAERISKIINTKLPDKLNIKHEGYKLIAQAELGKLRHACIQTRAINRWGEIVPEWDTLKASTLSIENVADRSFIFANLSSTYFKTNRETSKIISHEAEKSLYEINNYVDRIERYQIVAETLHENENSAAARDLLEKALDFAKAYSYEERDQMLGKIIEVAHNVEPALATNLASKIDNPMELSQINENIRAMTLHASPQKISGYTSHEYKDVLENVLGRLLKSIRSGKGTVQSSEIVGSYVLKSLGQDYETVRLATEWFIENTISGINSEAKFSRLDDLYNGLIQMTQLIRMLGDFLITNEAAITSNDTTIYKILSPEDTHTFNIGEKEKALDFIYEWISENANEHLKIYDPYFNEEFIFLLKSVPSSCRVQIITSAKTAEVESSDTKELYRRSWMRVCDQAPPETHIYVFYTNNGKTPLHDRFILSDSGGLSLGTSFNGFGSKNFSIQVLDINKKRKFETEFIIPIIAMPPQKFENQRLYQKIFTLDV
jgi:hypothetical protein